MPLNPNASDEENFKEVHEGKTYARTKKKYGRKVANKQAVAIVISAKRKAKKRSDKR